MLDLLFPAQTKRAIASTQITSEMVNTILRSPAVAIDIETDTNGKTNGWFNDDYGLAFPSEVTTIALAWREKDYRVEYFTAPFPPELLTLIQGIFNSNTVTLVAHNAVFEARQLAGKLNGGFVNCNVHDTMVMARLLHPEKQSYYDLKNVAWAMGVSITEEHAMMKTHRNKLHELDQQMVADYCASDTLVTLKIYEKQMELLTAAEDSEHLTNLYLWECRAMRCFCQMAARGIRLNVDYVQQRIKDLRQVAREALAKLKDDGLVDPSKRLSVSKYLYSRKNIPIPDFSVYSLFYTKGLRDNVKLLLGVHKAVVLRVFKTLPKDAKGQKSLAMQTDFEPLYIQELEGKGRHEPIAVDCALDKLSTSSKVMIAYVGASTSENDEMEDDSEDLDAVGMYKEQLQLLADYITSTRMLSTLTALLEHGRADGRLHSLVTINTHAGRRSAQHPQVQNWPMVAKPDDPAGDMCGVAVGDEGFTLVEIDFSNAENLIAAVISGDHNLAAACMAEDFHAYNAAAYFGDTWKHIEHEIKNAKESGNNDALEHWKKERKRLRTMSKAITFGTAYGMGARTLAFRLGIPLDEARNILLAKAAAYHKVEKAKELFQDKALKQGFIRLWSGRQVPVNPNKCYRSWNYGCQGGVAEMVKRSIVLITEEYEQRGMQSWVTLDMHDALVLNVAHAEWDSALAIASEVMEKILPQKFNERTTPNIVWTAQPDLAENTKKWGKFQLHPELNQVIKTTGVVGVTSVHETIKPNGKDVTLIAHVVSEETNAWWVDESGNLYQAPYDDFTSHAVNMGPYDTKEEAIAIGVPKQITPIEKLMFEAEHVDFKQGFQFRANVPISKLTWTELDNAFEFFSAYWHKVHAKINDKYTATFPTDSTGALNLGDSGKEVLRSDAVEMDMPSWAQAPLFWAYAARGCDVQALIGKSQEELVQLYEERNSQVEYFKALLNEIGTTLESICGWMAKRG